MKAIMAQQTPGFAALGVIGAIAALGIAAQSTRSTGQDTTVRGPYYTENFAGASACARCHTQKLGDDPEDFVVLTEYTTWRIHDKHSLAYVALEAPRGQQILQTLRKKSDKIDVAAETACLNCHGLHFPGRLNDPEALKDGVSCETCHGPSSKWMTPHSTEKDKWRRRTPEEKFRDYGMYDVRDPLQRANLCFSCHIGNASEGKVVTHAMFAAGHPPLRSMEIALFSENMPRHWRLTKDVPYLQQASRTGQGNVLKAYQWDSAPYQQSQLVLATSLGGLKAAMQLASDRANAAASDRKQRWPELQQISAATITENWPELALAHSDCYACHHELERPSWRQRRGYVGKPGRVQFRSWPYALAAAGIDKGPRDPLAPLIQQLANACSERPFGEPAHVADAARKISDWTAAAGPISNYQPDRAAWLKKLCNGSADDFPDFETARQLVAAIDVIHAECGAAESREWKDVIGQLRAELNLVSLDWARKERIRLLARLLGKISETDDLLKSPRALDALDRITGRGFEEAFADKSAESLAGRKEVNQFLATLRQNGGRSLTAAYYENNGAFLKELQTINNKEWDQTSEKMSRYDPARFRKLLGEVSRLVGER